MSRNHLERPMPTGAGIGLRHQHIEQIVRERPNIAWLEVLADNHMADGGLSRSYLQKVSEIYPITLHSVAMSIGSTDPLDITYLNTLKKIIRDYRPAYVSEHLCWTSVHGRHFPDLLPLPWNEATVKHVAQRIQQIQDVLGIRLLVENVSSYVQFKQSTMKEWEFVCAVSEAADCDLLFDVNNVYVNSVNHGFDAFEYVRQLPAKRVKQLHIAGYSHEDGYLLDLHGGTPSESVWALYEYVIQTLGWVPTLIEWDNNIGSLDELLDIARQADYRAKRIGDGSS